MSMLLGSSVLPSCIWIDHTRSQVQLGDVVRHAFKKSGLTEEQWNDLLSLEREDLLVRAVYEMRGG